jgi:hypothetical protein
MFQNYLLFGEDDPEIFLNKTNTKLVRTKSA